MIDKSSEIKDKLDALKKKYKNKSEALKKANKRIVSLEEKCKYYRNKDYAMKYHHRCFLDLTSHLDKFVYSIKYKYGDYIYLEP